MKLELEFDDRGQRREHTLELHPSAGDGATRGRWRFRLGHAAGEMRSADWAAVGPGAYSILLGPRSYEARVLPATGPALPGETRYVVAVGGREYGVRLFDLRSRRRRGTMEGGEGPQEILAPMPGRVVKVLAAEGQDVQSGEGILVIEAMKMQNELKAPRAGRVEKIYVREGFGVETGAKLLRLA